MATLHHRLGAILSHRLLPEAALAAAIGAICAVRSPTPPSFGGVDPNWATGINWAHLLGLGFGNDIVWTYGPLGFVEVPVLVSVRLAIIGIVVSAAFGALALVLVLLAASRRFSARSHRWLIIAGAALYLLIAPGWPAALVATLMFLVLAGVGDGGVTSDGYLAAAGASTAVLVLFKVNTVGLIAIVGAVAVGHAWTRRRVWTLLAPIVGFWVCLVGVWLVSRQSLSALLGFIGGYLQLSLGYSDMALERVEYAWGYLLFGITLVATVVYLVDTWRRRPWYWTVAISFSIYWAARLGFVRHEATQRRFFTALVPLLIVMLLTTSPLDVDRGRQRAAAAASLVVIGMMSFLGYYGSVLTSIPARVANGVQRAVQTVTLAVLPEERMAQHDAARTDIMEEAGVPTEIATMLSAGSWHAEPVDISVLWAYDADWDPLPVFQGYSAYRSSLDELNERKLAKSHPFVLERVGFSSLDQRRSIWDSPRTRVRLACEYRSAFASEAWQALTPSGERCEPPSVVDHQTAAAGTPIPVPSIADPGTLLMMRVEVPRSLGSRLLDAVWKPYDAIYVSIGGRRYRLPRGHLGAPLLLCAVPGSGVPAPIPTECPPTVTISHDASVTFEQMTKRPQAIPRGEG